MKTQRLLTQKAEDEFNPSLKYTPTPNRQFPALPGMEATQEGTASPGTMAGRDFTDLALARL